VREESVTSVVGGEFTVHLQSTPTTGYVWEINTLPDGIEHLGSDFEKLVSSLHAGDPIIQTFRFRALATGERIINFALKRQWESTIFKSHSTAVKVIKSA
jgi:predicted secreted protein